MLSLSKLSHGGDDSIEGVRRVDKAWVVARAHRELRAQSGVDAVLDVVLRGDVSDFNIS